MHLYLAFLIICSIESSDGTRMQNPDDPLCVGWTQMRPVAVRDCNRICRLNSDPRRFKLIDRYNKQKCWEMFEILVTHYLVDQPGMESIALFWCRGYEGMDQRLTIKAKHYLQRVTEECTARGL